MRLGKAQLCTARVHSWASDYMARVGIAPAVSDVAPLDGGALSPKERQADCGDTLASDPDALQRQYRKARAHILGALRVQPFSYANIIARANGLSPKKPADISDLRGLCSAHYDLPDRNPALEAAARPLARSTVKADVPAAESASTAAAVTDSRPARKSQELSSSVASVASASFAVPAAVVHWPGLSQMTKALERRILDHRHLWRAASMLASDHRAVREERRASKARPSAAPSPSTHFFIAGSLPFLLATIPHALVFSIAEHAILHAWHGGSHVYPEGKAPSATTVLTLKGTPLLRVDDVASLQWDRAQAANFLVTVLRQPVVQKELRQRLWCAAQNYHRGVLRKLGSLASPREAEDASQDVSDGRRILLEQQPGMPAPISLSLAQVQGDFFSFDETAYFVRAAPISYSNSRQDRVQCTSLWSTHLFHFASSRADVAAAFADRPRSNVSESLFRFSSLAEEAGAATITAPVSLSTRDKLWLLMSEMVRVRCLVAYLLNFELMLYQVRHSRGHSQAEQPALKDGDGAGTSLPGGAEPADGHDATNANCIAAVFRFLDIEMHTRLTLSAHHRRFLRRTRVRHCGRPSTPEPQEAANMAHEATDTGKSLTRESRRYATVQELFTAFSKTLDKSAEPPSQRPTTVASGAPSVKRTGEGQGASDDDDEGTCGMRGGSCGSNRMHKADDERGAARSPSPLSETDAELLSAIVSAARADQQPTPMVRCAPKKDRGDGGANSSLANADEVARSRSSPDRNGLIVTKPKTSPSQPSRALNRSQPCMDVVLKRESRRVKSRFQARRARTYKSVCRGASPRVLPRRQ
ncbi:hypothetical protein LSCM1_01393 [Leishmania martiniquensis]|uniref:Uncharacterized protein n=1 Tax=Leishmania martiniquensis TaxID=1580590 RepID=A0A836GD82_9TRYP|nr:hypothetical protein LSCM1_01393 [Leishmania martiniquensis]